MEGEKQKITADLRVVSATIKPHEYVNKAGDRLAGEVVQVQALGQWESHSVDGDTWGYPASLHITTYPGCGAIPMIGDKIRITVEQAPAEAYR